MTTYARCDPHYWKAACELLALDPARVVTIDVGFGWPGDDGVHVDVRLVIDRGTLIELAGLTTAVDGI